MINISRKNFGHTNRSPRPFGLAEQLEGQAFSAFNPFLIENGFKENRIS